MTDLDQRLAEFKADAENQPIYRISMEFRHATADDLKANSKQLKYGQLYILKSPHTNQFSENIKTITTHTAPAELLEYLNNKMIFVPVDGLVCKSIIETKTETKTT